MNLWTARNAAHFCSLREANAVGRLAIRARPILLFAATMRRRAYRIARVTPAWPIALRRGAAPKILAGSKPGLISANGCGGRPQRYRNGTRRAGARFLCARATETTIVMDRRDQEFLSKQLRHLPPSPRSEGTMILAIVAVFLAGVTVGALMFDYQATAMQTQAAARTRTAMSVPAPSAVPIAR
jgi:hypothetical protein